MASLKEEEDIDLHDDGDYYASLGIDRNATKEEINNAYRQYSRLYHPDKHQTQEKKLKAEQLFNKIKKAHEVLSDPQKKAIYDAAGFKGLQTEGWQLQRRHKTPQEIMDEYERLKKENEEKALQQRTNPKGSITVGIDATDIFERYQTHDDNYSSLIPNIEISDMQISQSVECPLTTSETVTISGQLSSRNGNGQGNITASIRKLFNHYTWGEAEVTLGSSPALSLRGFRTLWERGQAVIGCTLQGLPSGSVGALYNFTLVHQLDKHLHGRLNITAGSVSGVNTAVVYEKEGHRAILGCQLGVPSSFIVLYYSYVFKFIDATVKTTLKFGTFGITFEYGCDKKITTFSRLGASVVVGMPAGVSIRIRLSRGSQSFSFPTRLSEDLIPSAIFYGTLVPMVTFFAIKKFIVDPYVKEKAEKDLKEKKEKHTELFAKKKQEAMNAMDLMAESIDRSYEIERSRNGLIIVGALYGKDVNNVSSCIEISRCLQSLVKDSKLLITENTKLYNLPGLYDPSYGESKTLLIEYDYNDRRHSSVFHENQRVLLPHTDHILQ